MACEGITPHGLRRSAARRLVEDELIPEKLVMEIGGWKTGSTFKRYHIISWSAPRILVHPDCNFSGKLHPCPRGALP